MYNRRKPPYDPVTARAILRRARVTQRQVAKDLGVRDNHVSQVLDGYSQSQRVWDYVKALDGAAA